MIATTALRKISALRKPIKVIQGGQGAGKTFSILTILINHASSKENREVLIVSAELSKMRLNVIKDFVKLMREIGLYEDKRFIAGTLYRFPNGSFIKFVGLDKTDVGKGLRSHVVYFNEVNKLDRESYTQVASRSAKIFADYNPDNSFFIHDEVVTRNDCDFLTLTFEDNELLPDREREEILRYKEKGYNEDGSIKNEYWANKWRVYGLGLTGRIEGVVFQNWSEIDSVPQEAELIGYGMDFGFTNDPTTLIAAYRYNEKIILDELLYQRGLLNPDIAKILNETLEEYTIVYADSASPDKIAEIQTYGVNIMPVDKPKIVERIDFMQNYEYLVTKRSKNTIDEFMRYKWKVDKNGQSLNEPIDLHNHSLDAIGYNLWMNLRGAWIDEY